MRLLSILLTLTTLLSSDILISQTASSENQTAISKTKVYLLGSFHFAQTDSSYNVLDLKHQNELEKLATIAASQNIDKVFIERQPEYEFQNKIDSQYVAYVGGKKLTRKNEAFQLGFRIAKISGHQKVYQCDHPGQFGRYAAATLEFAKANNQMDALEATKHGVVQREDEIINNDSMLHNSSLLKYFQWLNSRSVIESSHGYYLTGYTQVGSTDFYNYEEDYSLVGAELTADWYKRNIMIYSKIINQLDYTEEGILILIGSDHVATLETFFEDNPYFDVVRAEDWLK